MSQQLVNQYLNDLDRYRKISGSLTEGVISEAFKDLLKAWARQANLTFVNQYEFPAVGQFEFPLLKFELSHESPTPMSACDPKETSLAGV